MCYVLLILDWSDWVPFIMFKHALHIFLKRLQNFLYLVEDTKHKRIIHYLLSVPLNFCKGLVNQVHNIRHVHNAKLPLQEVLTVSCKPL